MAPNKPKTINDYINEIAKLYAERETTSNEEDRAIVTKKIKDYVAEYGKKSATWEDVENAFAYGISSYVGVNETYVRATESKLAIVLRLLKQTGNISNSDYESAIKQFKAIDRDNNISREQENG